MYISDKDFSIWVSCKCLCVYIGTPWSSQVGYISYRLNRVRKLTDCKPYTIVCKTINI